MLKNYQHSCEKGTYEVIGQKGRCLSTTQGLSVHVPGVSKCVSVKMRKTLGLIYFTLNQI